MGTFLTFTLTLGQLPVKDGDLEQLHWLVVQSRSCKTRDTGRAGTQSSLWVLVGS